jgi:hypothetical protein
LIIFLQPQCHFLFLIQPGCVGVIVVLIFLLNLITLYYSILVCRFLPTVRAPREVRWEVEAGEGGDLTAHVHSAYPSIPFPNTSSSNSLQWCSALCIRIVLQGLTIVLWKSTAQPSVPTPQWTSRGARTVPGFVCLKHFK